MKAHLFLSCSALCMIMCIQAQGQTYYNFAVGTEVSGVYNSSHAIVRPIDASRAVAYYGGFGAANSVLAYIDLNTLTVSKLRLNGGYDQVKDIRIENNVVFFCGWNSQTSKGFIGHVTVADLASSTPYSIHCYDIEDQLNPMMTGTTAIMWRLAAYNDGTGTTRIVCLGNAWFHYGNNTLLMYESRDNVIFQMVDKLTQKHIVAAGGDYWMMKDIINDNPSTSCYTIAQQKVEALQRSPQTSNYHAFGHKTFSPQIPSIGEPMTSFILQGGCMTP